MVAIAMSLFVVGACSVAVLQVGLQADRVKRATTPRHITRTPRPGPEPLRLPPAMVPAHRIRSSLTLVVFATGIGMALAAGIGLVAVALAVALRAAVGA